MNRYSAQIRSRGRNRFSPIRPIGRSPTRIVNGWPSRREVSMSCRTSSSEKGRS